MKFAIFGGSFNPIHNGHLALAEAARLAFGYDRIILIPSFQSPFKPEFQGSSAQDRLDMCAAAISGDETLTLDDCEIKREGVSYTIDTVNYIDKKYRPDGKLGLIIGDDLAPDFHKWRNAEDLAAQTDIILARRLSANHDEISFSFPHKRLHNDIVELSSGAVRNCIEADKSWHFLVPQPVRFIIEKRGLYGCEQAASPYAEIIAHIEHHARMLLPFNRFIHSRNTALLASELCDRFGVDSQKGYLAGIAHDICKMMNEKCMIELVQKDGEEISKIEEKKFSLLHGRAAAVYIKENFQINDEDILEAVRFHTYASENMGVLAKIVYIADKIEIGREGIDPKMRDFTKYKDIDSLFELVFKDTVAYLNAKNLTISEGTLKLMEVIQKGRNP
ncbi:MAG: nicotinate (nicotinamide) nucleotide adenylyltransferase [Treponema sp.]|jgi:nicotinate-nucleotide adenylyltransferase|nr:nicotinate (nicotinamide) nucleotide adenylyltransferase [Treponema sp.]